MKKIEKWKCCLSGCFNKLILTKVLTALGLGCKNIANFLSKIMISLWANFCTEPRIHWWEFRKLCQSYEFWWTNFKTTPSHQVKLWNVGGKKIPKLLPFTELGIQTSGIQCPSIAFKAWDGNHHTHSRIWDDKWDGGSCVKNLRQLKFRKSVKWNKCQGCTGWLQQLIATT